MKKLRVKCPKSMNPNFISVINEHIIEDKREEFPLEVFRLRLILTRSYWLFFTILFIHKMKRDLSEET